MIFATNKIGLLKKKRRKIKMIHRCTECGEEIVSWLEENFKNEIEKHYLDKHKMKVEVIFDWGSVAKSSTMPHKGVVPTFKVVRKSEKQE